MSEPRRSTRARAREEAAPPPPPETPKETPSKQPAKSLKRKRLSVPAKDATPTTPATETEQQAPKQTLPIRLVDGQPLPTLSEPQPLDLPSSEYQDIQQSAVLSASLQRSRAVWVSGVNFRLFHAFFTPPKKVADRSEEDKQNIQRQKEIVRNFPQVGEASLVIEPHTFPIRLYGPREAARQLPKKPPTVYGQWPNHNQQNPYQYGHAPATPYQPPPQQRPPPPKPPPPPKAPPPAPNPSQTPAPDPVIHMLAQRAGQDPELKAVMKIVAAGQATKEQLEFFQGHISELTNILQKQKEAAAKAPPPPPPPLPPPPPKAAPPPPTPPQPQPLPPVKQQQNTPKPFTPAPQAHQPQMAPAPPQQQSYAGGYNNNYHLHPPQYQQPQHMPHYAPANPPPRSTYRPLVFDFVEGNGDKFYFPTYTFLEWLPNTQGAKFSFLVTKLKLKPKPEAKANAPSTPAPKPAAPPTVAATLTAPASTPVANGVQPTPNQNTPVPGALQNVTPAPPVTPYVAPPRIEDFDERNDMKDIDFYQPVTVLVLTSHSELLQTLPRAIRAPDVVGKYMDEVFDTCRRAEETFLAFRLPRENAADAEGDDKKAKSGDATPAVSTPTADILMGGMGAAFEKKRTAGRPRKSLLV